MDAVAAVVQSEEPDLRTLAKRIEKPGGASSTMTAHLTETSVSNPSLTVSALRTAWEKNVTLCLRCRSWHRVRVLSHG